MAGAKEEILSRVRNALSDVSDYERSEDVAIERGYRKEDEAPREEIVDRFAEYVAEYRATVHRVSEDEFPKAVAEALERREIKRLVVPEDLPDAWIPDNVEVLRDGESGAGEHTVRRNAPALAPPAWPL